MAKLKSFHEKDFEIIYKFIFFLSISIIIFGCFMPFVGPNSWRDAQTFSVARNFFNETFNILTPHYDLRGLGNGSLPGEFPLYSYIVGFFLKVISPQIFIGRFINLIASILIVLIISKKLNLSFFLIGSLFFSNTMLFSQSFSTMPEIFSILFLIFCIYFFEKNFIATLVCLVISTLIKPSGFMVFPYLFFISSKKFSIKNALLFTLPLLSTFAWKNFTLRHNYLIYPIMPNLFEHYTRNFNIILNEINYLNLFHALKKFTIHGISIIGVFSFLYFRKEKIKLILPIVFWLAACFTFLVISGNVQRDQVYYATPIAIPAIFLSINLIPKNVLPFLIFIQFCINLAFYQHKYFFSNIETWSKYYLENEIDKFSKRDDRFIALGVTGDSTNLGRIGRQGLVLNSEDKITTQMKNYQFIYSESILPSLPTPNYKLSIGYVWKTSY